MTTHDLLRARIHRAKGLPLFDFSELTTTEWSSVFECLMRRRLLMGGLRYGLLNAEGKRKYNRVKDMIKRLKLYDATGNLEHLVDVANLAMCEYEETRRPDAHFASLDDHNHHTK